jgi:glutathionylspermidine synthase
MELSPAITIAESLSGDRMAAVTREAIFACCKWDPQVGDVAVLANFALVISPAGWGELAAEAERLYAETLAAEAEIARTPHLIKLLGLPSSLESALLAAVSSPFAADREVRVMRFDFHVTDEGWKISEVNSDVPGGYIEAAGFSALMAPHYPGCTPAADPVAALSEAWKRRVPAGSLLGLVHATAYTDDRQVMVYLQRRLKCAGLESRLLSPEDIQWQEGRARAGAMQLGGLFRFFPAEWLPNLSGSHWRNFFLPTVTPQTNPGRAALSQSKRFPLTWEFLSAPPATWQRLLPECRAWQAGLGSDWVSKPNFGRVGDGIGIEGVTSDAEWKAIRKSQATKPGAWMAQRKFRAVAFPTPTGPGYPCFGVYVIDGRASGIYGRIAPRPLVDHLARDVAVLVSATASRVSTSLKSA